VGLSKRRGNFVDVVWIGPPSRERKVPGMSWHGHGTLRQHDPYVVAIRKQRNEYRRPFGAVGRRQLGHQTGQVI
jgi:hypothetical protein